MFLSSVAQEENLGDMILRRSAIDWVAQADAVPHVLVAGMPADFVAGLRLPESAVAYTTTSSWFRAMVSSLGRRDASLLFTPGPQSATLNRANLRRAVINALLAMVVVSRGGHVVKLGRSIEVGSKILLALERHMARRTALYTVRDRESVGLLRRPAVRTSPDMAMSLDMSSFMSDDTPERTLASLSFRGDRTVPSQVLERLVSELRARGCTPLVVSQVRRDNAFHQQLAQQLGCEALLWPDREAHDAHLTRVMRAYQRSTVVLSNRLHGLIFGLAAGATPVGLTSASDTKIRRTFGVLGLDQCVHDVDAELPLSILEPVELAQQQESAQASLISTRDELSRLLWSER